MEKNKLFFPLICAVIIAVMYFFAFHNQRDKNEFLKEKIVKLEKIINDDRK
jgi:hypothetical protein